VGISAELPKIAFPFLSLHMQLSGFSGELPCNTLPCIAIECPQKRFNALGDNLPAQTLKALFPGNKKNPP